MKKSDEYPVVPIPNPYRVSEWDGLCRALKETPQDKARTVTIAEGRELQQVRTAIIARARRLGIPYVQSKIDPESRTITVWRATAEKIHRGRKRINP
jgi:hypothetical protein